MSSVVLSGDTSGTVTLTVPAVAGTNTVTVPAATGTMIYKDSNGTTTLNSNASQNPLYVQVNGTEVLRVQSNGTVGIGTSSPNNYLQVTGAKTNTDAASTGQMVIQDTSAYNSSPIAGIQFAIKYTSSGTYAYGTAIQGIKDNSTDGNFGQSLRFVTQANGASPSEKMRLDSTGGLFIGTTTAPTSSGQGSGFVPDNANGVYRLILATTTTGTQGLVNFQNPNGTVGYIATAGTGTVYSTTSDYRLKENVQPMVNALNTVSKLNPVNYKWKTDGTNGQGFIAHELQEIFPEAVIGEKDAVNKDGNPAYQSIDTSFLVATLTAAIKELNAKVDAQAVEIAALKAGK